MGGTKGEGKYSAWFLSQKKYGTRGN